MPEKGRHESGGSERPRIRRSGRGSMVLQEGARSVSHLQPFAGNFASLCREFHDRPDWLGGGFLALGDHYHMQMLSSSEGSRLCGESVTQ